MTASWYQWEGDNLLLHLKVQPKASSDQWIAPHGDQYRIRITAPPTEGKANAHLTKLLARAFGVPRTSIQLLSGKNGRNKRFRILAPSKTPIDIPSTENK